MSGESVIDIFQPYDHIPRHLQSDIGYPATSGPAPIQISDLAGYGGVKHRNCSSVYTCVYVYLLVATVLVTNYQLYKMDIY